MLLSGQLTVGSGQLWYPFGIIKSLNRTNKLIYPSRRDSITVNCQLSTVNFFKQQRAG